MADGSDAIADWPILNALLNVASGAAWVAVHHGGGVGMGQSIHAGAQVVADGTDDAALRLSLVLRNDPGTGVDAPRRRRLRRGGRHVARERGVRHADARSGGGPMTSPDSRLLVRSAVAGRRPATDGGPTSASSSAGRC